MRKWTPIIYYFLISVSEIIAQEDHVIPEGLPFNQNENEINQFRDQTTALITINPENHIDINEIPAGMLEQFDFLDAWDIDLINTYIWKHRPLLSIYELQSIRGIDLWKIKKLIPHLKISTTNKMGWKDFGFAHRSAVVLSWSKSIHESNTNEKYLGLNDRIRFRFQNSNPGKYSYGLLLEKDAGEKLIQNHSSLPDYTSFHFFLQQPCKLIHSIAIGDYAVRFGQGLLLDKVYSPGGTASFGALIKTSAVIKPYHSLNESSMLRGIGIDVRWKKMLVLSFLSFNKLDANLVLDTTHSILPEIKFSSINVTGLHRDESEIQDRHRLHQLSFGSCFQQQIRHLKFGVNVLAWRNNYPLDATERLDLIHVENEKLHFYSSFHHQFRYRQWTHFGELGISKTGQKALFDGLLLGIGKQADAFLHVRYYDPGFRPLDGSAYASGSEARNEKGLMCGLNCSPIQKYQFTIFADHWRKLWLSYQFPEINQGQDYSCRITRLEKKNWMIYVQYRYSTLIERDPGLIEKNHLNAFKDIQSHHFRIHLEKKINPVWTWRCRYEIHQVNKSNGKNIGQIMYSDVLYKSIERPYSGSFRLAMFQVPNYESRIYAYENDLLFQQGIPLYYGQGLRSYVNFRWKWMNNLSLELRFSKTYYFFRDQFQNTITNLNTLDDEEIKFQIYYSF